MTWFFLILGKREEINEDLSFRSLITNDRLAVLGKIMDRIYKSVSGKFVRTKP
ncbi:hypothetical protein DI53_3597 [Sphingobacterium deserti]|uniref:Uncharacterized protein n=1 Tax=Sphingobacterium deserti TaxID=1229276 RepID=A0A0B8SYS0_9SPHI|nr:hypothetical protein DI53_3597 [Sphingobacterium deserti]